MISRFRYSIMLLPIMLGSCTKSMYVPNMINTPMFERKGQLNSSLTLRDLQFAYAATKKIGFTLNGYYRPQKLLYLDNGKEGNYQNSNKGVDMAFVCYKVLPKSINEVLLGYGQGSTSFSYSEYGGPRISNRPSSRRGGSSDFQKFYFQYDHVWFARKETKWAFTTRLEVVSLVDFKDAYGTPIPSCTSVIFAPGLSMRKKIEMVSILAQVQCPLPTAVDENKLFFSNWGQYPPFHARLMMNLGVMIHLNDPQSKRDDK